MINFVSVISEAKIQQLINYSNEFKKFYFDIFQCVTKYRFTN